jgi:hypothetical protein
MVERGGFTCPHCLTVIAVTRLLDRMRLLLAGGSWSPGVCMLECPCCDQWIGAYPVGG